MKKLIKNYGETVYKWTLLVLFMIVLTTIIKGCIANSQTTHDRLQKELTFDKVMKDNESFTLESYREDIKTLEAKLKELQKKQGNNSKKADLMAKLEELRKQIAELENQKP